MRNKIVFLFCVVKICFLSTAQEVNLEQKKIIKEFIQCIESQDSTCIERKIVFPIHRELPLLSIKNAKEFIEQYNSIFDKTFIEELTHSDIQKDWSVMGSRGIMYKNGELWLNYQGKLISINYVSDKERLLVYQMQKKDKRHVYKALRNYKKLILFLETKDFKIRIDQPKDNLYRYASWDFDSNISQKPDLILCSDKLIFDGTLGNHSYIFKNKDVTYICQINVNKNISKPKAYLIIEKNGHILEEQDAKIIQ